MTVFNGNSKNKKYMEYSFSNNLRDSDGDVYEKCLLVHIGKDTIIKFKDVNELEQFGEKLMGSLKEIRETT